MLGSYTARETFLAAIVLALTLYELRGVILARLTGHSKNLSRLLTHLVMLVLLVLWLSYTFYWSTVMAEPGISFASFGSTALNLPYLLLGIGLVLIATVEILALFRARREGYTKNVSRLVTHFVIVLAVLTMVGLSVRQWSSYGQSDRGSTRGSTSSSIG